MAVTLPYLKIGSSWSFLVSPSSFPLAMGLGFEDIFRFANQASHGLGPVVIHIIL